MKVFALTLLHLFPLTLAGLTAEMLTELIPTSFPGSDQDASLYTVRYLSQQSPAGSEEGPACLQDQLHNGPTNITYCNTLRYSLSRNDSDSNSRRVQNSYLLLLVSPGIYPYGHGVSENIDLLHSRNVIIAKNPLLPGEVVLQCATLNSDNFNNLYMRGVANVALLGLTFTRCGQKSNALAIVEGENVTIESCTFRDNPGGGMLLRQVKGIFILNSIFKDNRDYSLYNENRDLSADLRRGSGLTIFYLNDTELGQTLVTNCTFENNSATLNESNQEDALDRPRLYVPRGHGGGLLLAFQNASGHRVDIRDCLFKNNTAKFTGGAISIQFYRGLSNAQVVQPSSHDNVVMIENSSFWNNTSLEKGGGVSINAFETANENTVVVNGSLFDGNFAGQNGGALSSIIEDYVAAHVGAKLSTVAIVQRSSFSGNSAMNGGSAINLVSNGRYDQATESAWISDCHFFSNRDQSALLSLRHPITLRGQNTFRENMGGAVTLLQAQLNISGQILFEGNIASNGAGIKLLDQSTLSLQDEVNMTFLSNHAFYSGGAIKVVSTVLTEDIHVRTIHSLNLSCFIQFSNFSAVTISFINNTAGQDGAAIYATNLETCAQQELRPEEGERSHSILYYNDSIFALDPPFKFSNNKVVNNSARKMDAIATEPSHFVLTEEFSSQFESSQSLQVSPGGQLHLNISAVDQVGNKQPAFWAANFKEGLYSSDAGGKVFEYNFRVDSEAMRDSYKSVCEGSYEGNQSLRTLSMQPEQLEFFLIRATTGEMANTSRVNVTLTCCPPGHSLSGDVCLIDNAVDEIFIRYDSINRYFYIKPQFYADVRDGSIVWATTPVSYQDCTQAGNLPGCLFEYNRPEAQCSENRTGFLCGTCPNGTYADLTFTSCIKCPPWHTVLIVAIVLAFAVVCGLVMMFNIGIPSEVRGFLFFVQVVGFVYSSNTLWDFHLANVFGFSLYVPLCPYPGYTTLQLAAFGYILPLAAVVTIILYIISAKFIKRLSNKNSFDGIWFLTFIIYKFTADSCFDILRCEKIKGLKDKTEYVYFYNGEQKCFTTEDTTHLRYAVAAVIIAGITAVIPIFILVISYKRFQLTVNITDVINKDVKASCRWWSSFDLFRRLLFIYMEVFFGFSWPAYSQFAQLCSGLLVFSVFAFAQPYKSKIANILEALTLLDLLLISAIYLNTDVLVVEELQPLATTLLLAPFIVALPYLICKITAFVCWKCFPPSLKSVCLGSMCKLLNRMGIKLPPVMKKLECAILLPPTLVAEQESTTVDEEDLIVYVPYREELFEDFSS